jgi:hypothetical protein
MSWEPVSPELALVDPELGARARAALPSTPIAPSPRALVPSPPRPASAPDHHRSYPAWARITAALWLVVLGILVGGAAVPHAQDTPRIVPPSEDATFCKNTPEQPVAPTQPPSRPGP